MKALNEKLHTEHLQLLSEAVDVLLSSDTGMCPCLYGILLCWQAKCVPSNRMQHVVALQAISDAFAGSPAAVSIC